MAELLATHSEKAKVLTPSGVWAGFRALSWGFPEAFGLRLDFDPVYQKEQWMQQGRPDVFTVVFVFETGERMPSNERHISCYLKRRRIEISIEAQKATAKEIELDWVPVYKESSPSVSDGHSDFWRDSD